MSKIESEVYSLLSDDKTLSKVIECSTLEEMYASCKEKTWLTEHEFIDAINNVLSTRGQETLIEEISATDLGGYYKIRAC